MAANLLFQLRNSYRVVSAHNIWWQRISGVIVCLLHVTLSILYSVCYTLLLVVVVACWIFCSASVIPRNR